MRALTVDIRKSRGVVNRIVAVLLVFVTLLLGCHLVPASITTCDSVAPEVCRVVLEQVRAVFERSGEVLLSASVSSPTRRGVCMGDEVPLADVVVRLEGKPDAVLVTVSRTLAGQAAICF